MSRPRVACLETLENDNVGLETVHVDDDGEASLDDDDQGFFFIIIFVIKLKLAAITTYSFIDTCYWME